METLLEQNKLQRVSNAVAAGVTTINSTAIDSRGFDSVTFFVAMGAIVAGAATSCKLQGGEQSDGSDAVDLLGTSLTIADTDDDKLLALELNQPTFRYVRCVVLRATQNSTIDGIVALLGNPKTLPPPHDAATVLGSEIHVAPGAGIA